MAILNYTTPPAPSGGGGDLPIIVDGGIIMYQLSSGSYVQVPGVYVDSGGVTNITALKVNGQNVHLALPWISSTSTFLGGKISSGVGNTIDQMSGLGHQPDFLTNPSAPVMPATLIPATTGNIIPDLNTSNLSHFYNDMTGNVVITTVGPTPEQRYDYKYQGYIDHRGGVVREVVWCPEVGKSPNAAIYSLAFGLASSITLRDNVIVAGGNNLTLSKTEGLVYRPGIGGNSAKDSNTKVIPAANNIVFDIFKRDGIVSSNVTELTPSLWDNNGTVETIPGSSSRASLVSVYQSPSGSVEVALGTQWYGTKSQAIQALATERPPKFSFIDEIYTLRATIAITKGCVNLLDDTTASIIEATPFGQATAGAGGSSVTDLQRAYVNSAGLPQVLVDQINGPVTMQSNTGNDNDIVTQVRNNAGQVTYSVSGSGNLDVKGETLFLGAVGFNNTPPVVKPVVTGSKGGNAALASLLLALASTGLITDSTT